MKRPAILTERRLLPLFDKLDGLTGKGARAVEWLVSIGIEPETAIAQIAAEIDEMIRPDQRTALGEMIERLDGPVAELLLTRAYRRLCQESMLAERKTDPA